MDSDEYVSCELYYIKNDFSSFSVAVEIGLEAEKGMPLWAILVIILGCLLVLLILVISLWRNKKFRERLKRCCKKNPLAVKLDPNSDKPKN